MKLFLPFFFSFLIAVGLRADDIDLAVPIGSQKTPVAGLALYYSFDDGASLFVKDGGPSGLAASLAPGAAAGPPTYVPGVDLPGTSGYGKAIYFANPTFSNTTPQSHLETPLTQGDTPLNLPKTSFTVGFWIKIASFKKGVAQATWIIDKQSGSGSTSSDGWNVLLAKDDTDQWRVTLGLSNSVDYCAAISSSNSNIGDGNWHHIGINFNYNPGTSSVSFWFDGHSSTPETYTDGFAEKAEVGNNTSPFFVAQRNLPNPGFGSPFDGSIDDLFVATQIYGFTPLNPAAGSTAKP